MEKQEQELLEGYRKLRPESKRLIMETVITAVVEETAVKRQDGLSTEGNPEPLVTPGKDKAFD